MNENEKTTSDPPNEATILVVEDDDTLALGITRCLELEGYYVLHCATGEAGLAAAEDREPDLVVLDWMLPGIDGLSVLERLKQDKPELPVIMLTARDSEQERIRGLDAGADDYVVKPFSVKVLAARIRARLRSRVLVKGREGWVNFGNVRVDLRHRISEKDGEEQRLTTHEAGVLEYLMARPGKDIPRDELLEKVWGYVPTIATRTVDNQILKLRKKLEDNTNDPRHILTVYGTGYRFEF